MKYSNKIFEDKDFWRTANKGYIFKEIAFNTATKTEELVIVRNIYGSDSPEDSIISKEFPLGTTFVYLLNCDLPNKINLFKKKLKIYITSKDRLRNINDAHFLDRIFDEILLSQYMCLLFESHSKGAIEEDVDLCKTEAIYDKLCEFIECYADEELITELINLIKTVSSEVLYSDPIFNSLFICEINITDTLDEYLSDAKEKAIDSIIILDFVFLQMFTLLSELNIFLNALEEFKKRARYICCVGKEKDLGDLNYLTTLSNLQRAYLYQSKNSKFEYKSLFNYKCKNFLKIKGLNDSMFFDFYDDEMRATIISNSTVTSAESIDLYDRKSFVEASLLKMIEENIKIQKCRNCDRYFIPKVVNNTIYCDGPAPQNSSKTCKQFVSGKLYYQKLKNDPLKNRARKIYQRLQVLAKRHPDIQKYKIDYDAFKQELKNQNQLLKDNKVSSEEYNQWLDSWS